MKTETAPQPLKAWSHNERCLCKSRRARFGKYTHNGKRATVTVCVAGESGEILNWQNQNVALADLTEYPDPMPAGFWWDENGVLCWPAPSEKSPADDSPNLDTGENQISADNDSPNLDTGENQISADNDSPNLDTGENQISADNDSPNLDTGENQISADNDSRQDTLGNVHRVVGKLPKIALLTLRDFINDRLAALDEQLEEKDVPVKSGRQVVKTLVAGSVVYRQEKVSCGKPTCKSCPHGPYWYSYQRVAGRVKSKYLGKNVSAL